MLAVLLTTIINTVALRLPSASVLVGTSVPSAATSHTFSFEIASAGPLGSIRFEYCSNDPLIGAPCFAPAGLDVSSASLTSQTGETGFVINPLGTDANHLLLTRVVAAASTVPVVYAFDGLINPSTAGVSTFIRIYTYPTSDGTGAYTDAGAAIFSTSGQLSTSGFVTPYITSCVGISVALDCSSTTGSLADFGNLTTSTDAAVTSQLSMATNDPTGYIAYVFGTTLTSGNNTIPALGAPTASNPGNSQFGINLRANSSPTVGSDPQGIGSGTASGGYDNPDLFQFVNNSAIASSPIPTEFNRFTVSYIANINGSQSAGNYASTITYVAIAASF